MDKTQRDHSICEAYKSGWTAAKCATEFGLAISRIRQILANSGVRREHIRNTRKFLGVNISETTKHALTQKAQDEGVSVSKLTSDALDELVK